MPHEPKQIDWYAGTGAFYLAGLIMLAPNFLVWDLLLRRLPYVFQFILGALLFFASSYVLTAIIIRKVRRLPLSSPWRSWLE